jgi:citrate lyase subunit beta/citryl-CoA lyase
MTVIRSLLFVPGNRTRMLEKALGLRPDAYVPDMEDSVPLTEKANARSITASMLPRLASAGPLVIPRVNSLGTGLLEDDLEAVVGPHIYGVSVGKIASPEDVAAVSEVLERLEALADLEAGAVKLVLWIETALGVVNAYSISAASQRIVGVAFGAEDFTADMGIGRTPDQSEVEYPRRVVCVAARAAGIPALDTPYFTLRDPEGLRSDAAGARAFGFKGKFAIHPEQIQVINETFSPSGAEVEYALRVVAAFEEAERRGTAATSLDGKVVDVPVVERARGVLALAEETQEDV